MKQSSIAVLIIVLLQAGCSPQKAEQPNVPSTEEITRFLDQWHQAAAVADAEVFFGSMADSSIYIGTDATERWTKQEFITFAKPYFDRGKAWDFKPFDRDIHVSTDGAHVWFSELLSTWMGVCRGPGIMTRNDHGWKIEQYHLSVTVPNDIIGDFISLIENFEKQQKSDGEENPQK